MNKISVIILCLIFSCGSVRAEFVLPRGYKYLPENAEKTNNFIQNRQRYNVLYFNILQLERKQVAEFENITLKYDRIYTEYTDKLVKAAYKYKAMQDNKLPIADKIRQRKEINVIYKLLKRNSKNEIRDLTKILNKSQRSKYKLIKHLEIHDVKKGFHTKDYYKSNPLMNRFGDPKIHPYP